MEIRDELFEWFRVARFTDRLTERRRAILDAEQDRKRAGEYWNDYVEARENLGLKPAESPWNLKTPVRRIDGWDAPGNAV